MPPKKSTAMTTATPTGLAAPSYIKHGDTRGTENLRSQDMKMPFLMIAEKLSPAVEGGFVDPGNWFINVSKESLGDTVEFLIISQLVKRERRASYNDGGEKLCESRDMQHGTGSEGGQDKTGKPTTTCLNCVLKEWGKDNKGKILKPQCGEVGWWLVQMKGKPGLLVLSLSNTRFAAHRTLSSLAATLKGQQLPGFAKYVRAKLTEKKNGKNAWCVPEFELADYAGEKDYTSASEAYDSMGAKFAELNVSEAAE